MTEKLKQAQIDPEELGECCYCGFTWKLRYSPERCPHCGHLQHYIRFPDGTRLPSWR